MAYIQPIKAPYTNGSFQYFLLYICPRPGTKAYSNALLGSGLNSFSFTFGWGSESAAESTAFTVESALAVSPGTTAVTAESEDITVSCFAVIVLCAWPVHTERTGGLLSTKLLSSFSFQLIQQADQFFQFIFRCKGDRYFTFSFFVAYQLDLRIKETGQMVLQQVELLRKFRFPLGRLFLPGLFESSASTPPRTISSTLRTDSPSANICS